MKILFLTLIFCLSTVFLTAQTPPKSAKLVTIDDNYQAALKKAKKTNRPVFAIVYSMNCGIDALNEALNNDTIIDFLNNNFITLMIRNDYDVNNKFIEKYTYHNNTPRTGLFIIDPKMEKLMHKYTGYFATDVNKKSILRTAQWALQPEMTYGYAVERYAKEKDTITDKAFLVQFLELMRSNKEIIPEYVNYYRKSIDYKNPCFEDLRFIYDYCIYQDDDVHLYLFTVNTPEFRLLLEQKELFCKYFDSTQIINRIVFIFPHLNYAEDTIIDNFDTILLSKYLFYDTYDKNGGINNFVGDVIFASGDEDEYNPAQTINLGLKLKAFMYKKAGDEKEFAKYANQYLSETWNSYWNLYSWVSTWMDRPECGINDSLFCEGVLQHMLQLEQPKDFYAHAYLELAELKYQQGKINEAVHYFNNGVVKSFAEMNAFNQDETNKKSVFYPLLQVEATDLGQKLKEKAQQIKN